MAIGVNTSIITLNVNRLNAPTKRHRLAEWIQKQDPYICLFMYEVDFFRQHSFGSYFCIHSTSLCLFVGAFNSFTFKLIVDTYVPNVIFLVAWGLIL